MIGCGFNSLYCPNMVDFTKAEQKKFNSSKIVNTNPISIIDPDRSDKKNTTAKTVATVAAIGAITVLALKYGKRVGEILKNIKLDSIKKATIDPLKNIFRKKA